MGMFDTIWVKCPNCGIENDFQTKSGECLLHNYNLEDCPDDALANVNRHSPCVCECGTSYEVEIASRKAVIITPLSASNSTEASATQGKSAEQKYHAVEYSGYWSIQTGPMYGDNDILNAEHVGENAAEKYATLIAEMLNNLKSEEYRSLPAPEKADAHTVKEFLESKLIVGAKIRIGKYYSMKSNFKEGQIIELVKGVFEKDNGLYVTDVETPSYWDEEQKEFDSIYHLFGNELHLFMDCIII